MVNQYIICEYYPEYEGDKDEFLVS